MSRKNKWSFIENKEAREALINGSDLLKKCAKTYYVGYKNRFDEIVEPYRYICEGISGVKGTVRSQSLMEHLKLMRCWNPKKNLWNH